MRRITEFSLLFLFLLPFTNLCQPEELEAQNPLVAPGPPPDAVILFLGNLQGSIEPCF